MNHPEPVIRVLPNFEQAIPPRDGITSSHELALGNLS